jgi:hypothetical protein
MKRLHRLPVAGGVALLVVALTLSAVHPAASEPQGPANRILARELALERQAQPGPQGTPGERAKILPGVSGGVMTALREALDAASGDAIGRASTLDMATALSNTGAVPPSRTSAGCPNVFRGSGDVPDNIRVNQDCTLRRQAEEVVVVNPRDHDNLIAGQNDSRIGFNHCGYDWSLDRGRNWGDTGTSPPPFWQELLDDLHTADACSDPSATFDHLGNAYSTGVFFDIASPASAIFVAKSNAPIKGRFYHIPAAVSFQEYRTTPMGRPASDNDPDLFHDKELMVADSRTTSPKKGRVYVTWTRFQATATPVGARSPIVFSQSTDGGATWSPQVIISGTSSAFCTVFSGTPNTPNACDQDQGSHPVVGADGTIYVIFGNGNTPDPGINQVLMVRCPPNQDCNDASDWEGPFRISSLIGTHPFGPAAAGCPGRQCLPPNGYRVPEFTSMSISVDRNNNLYATWADHRNNTNPNCDFRTSPAGNGTPPCDHDVFYSFSTNRGTTWSPTLTVTPRSRLGNNAQWQPWSDVAGDGSRVYVGFYDRQYGSCENTGCNDITLATISNPRSSNPRIGYQRITTASMPNLVPANNPVQAGFLGDYMWVEVSRHDFNQRDVHLVWADTRPLFGSFPEEDIYYARIRGDGDRDRDDGGDGDDDGDDGDD